MRRRRHEPEQPLLDPEIESELHELLDTGTRHFADAWHAGDADGPTSESVDALGAQTDDDRRRSDAIAGPPRRIRGARVLVAVVVLAGGALTAASALGWLEEAPPPTDLERAVEVELVAPGAGRAYEPAPEGPTAIEATRLRDAFGQDGDGTDLEALTEPDAAPHDPDASMATVIWGQRLHVLVGGRGVGTARCVVATLVTADLRAVDVATFGAGCARELAVTSDRVACAGPDLVMLEMWPPEVVLAQTGATAGGVDEPTVASVRARVELDTTPGGLVVSFRIPLNAEGPPPVVTSVRGRPGEELRVTLDGRTSACTLIDRSGVALRFL